MIRIISILSGMVLMTLTHVGVTAPISTSPPVNVGAGNVNLLNSQISAQLGMVESASKALTLALQALAEAQSEKPNRSGSIYHNKDSNGNKVFNSSKYNADMNAWQSKISHLTNLVNKSQAKLAQEESKLRSLQSQIGGAMSNDNRRRQQALDRERKKQESMLRNVGSSVKTSPRRSVGPRIKRR